MKETIKKLYTKYREIIIYIVVGLMTTIFSWICCYLSMFILDSEDAFQNFIITTITWLSGVIFSYPLNRIWVFKSKNKNIFKEFLGHAASRLSTYFLDVFIMWLFVNVIPFTPLITKLANSLSLQLSAETLDTINYWFVRICISAVLVTIANYLVGKLLVFRKKKEAGKSQAEKE